MQASAVVRCCGPVVCGAGGWSGWGWAWSGVCNCYARKALQAGDIIIMAITSLCGTVFACIHSACDSHRLASSLGFCTSQEHLELVMFRAWSWYHLRWLVKMFGSLGVELEVQLVISHNVSQQLQKLVIEYGLIVLCLVLQRTGFTMLPVS